jgi:hypothetical protein
MTFSPLRDFLAVLAVLVVVVPSIGRPLDVGQSNHSDEF